MSGPMVLMLLASLAAGAALIELAGQAPSPRRTDGFLRGRSRTARARKVQAAPSARARWAVMAGADAQTERLLDAAGRVGVADAAAFAVRRRLAATVGAAWGVAIGLLFLPVGLAIAAGFAAGAVGRAVPGLHLLRAGRTRAAALRQDVPELLDLLAVAMGCGLPVGAALAGLAEWGAGPLAASAGRAARELEHGAGIDQALTRLVREHPVPELEAAVAVLQRARRHGTPAAEPLRALAAGARQSRARRAMDHAAKAAPRVQLVAALLLVPAALCVLAASLVAGGIGR